MLTYAFKFGEKKLFHSFKLFRIYTIYFLAIKRLSSLEIPEITLNSFWLFDRLKVIKVTTLKHESAFLAFEPKIGAFVLFRLELLRAYCYQDSINTCFRLFP